MREFTRFLMTLFIMNIGQEAFSHNDFCDGERMFHEDFQVCIYDREAPPLFEEVLEIESFPYFYRFGGPQLPMPAKYQDYKMVLLGPVFRSNNLFNDYNYWRYVTFYNVQTYKKQMMEFPRIYEECHDENHFSQYDETSRITVTLESSLKFADIGIRGTIQKTKEIGVRRTLTGIFNEEAEHVPYLISETWSGKSFIQTYDSKTKQSVFKHVVNNRFLLKDVNPMVRVERKKIKDCQLTKGESESPSLLVYRKSNYRH